MKYGARKIYASRKSGSLPFFFGGGWLSSQLLRMKPSPHRHMSRRNMPDYPTVELLSIFFGKKLWTIAVVVGFFVKHTSSAKPCLEHAVHDCTVDRTQQGDSHNMQPVRAVGDDEHLYSVYCLIGPLKNAGLVSNAAQEFGCAEEEETGNRRPWGREIRGSEGTPSWATDSRFQLIGFPSIFVSMGTVFYYSWAIRPQLSTPPRKLFCYARSFVEWKVTHFNNATVECTTASSRKAFGTS